LTTIFFEILTFGIDLFYIFIARSSSTKIRNQASHKITSFKKLEIEFAKMTTEVKKALHQNNVCTHELIDHLTATTAVRDRNVPLFDEEVYGQVTSINDLWRKLRTFWTIYDYDLLIVVVELTECEEAQRILDNFLEKIDPSALNDINLVLHLNIYDKENLLQPTLRVKVNTEKCTCDVVERVKEIVSKKFDLEKYALYLVGIKEGCVELLFHTSKAVRLYLLKFTVTESMMDDFAIKNIVSLQIGDVTLKVKPDMMVSE